MKKKTESFNLKLFLDAIKEKYPNDITSPGIVIGRINTGEYYVCIKRYTGPIGTGPYTVIARKHMNLTQALKITQEAWLDSYSPKETAFEKLSRSR